MTRTETLRILAVLRTVWPDIPVTEEGITGWTWAFEDVPYSLVEDAAKRYVRTGKFAPKPAELLELIGVQLVAPGLVPEAAWTEVLAEVRRVGFNRMPVWSGGGFLPTETRSFSSPLIAQAVDAVGWETICTSEKPEIVRAQFLAALKAVVAHAVRAVQTGDAAADAPAIAERVDGPIPMTANGVRR